MKLGRQNIPFTMVANDVLVRPNLSMRAKGLYAYLFSKPEGWDFSADRIVKDCSESRPTVLKVLKEIESAGLLVRRRQKTGRVEYLLQYSAEESSPDQGTLLPAEHKPQSTLLIRAPKKASIKAVHGGQVLPVSNKEQESNKEIYIPADLNSLIDGFEPMNPSFERLFANRSQRAALDRLVKKHGVGKITGAIRAAAAVYGKEFAPAITTPLQLEEKMGTLVAFYKRTGAKGPAVVSL